MRILVLPRPRSIDAGLLQKLGSFTPYGIAIVFFLIYFLSYPRVLGEAPLLNASREHNGYLLSEQAAHGNGFKLELQHFHELPADVARALTPRDAAILDDKVAPQDFAGTMLLYASAFAVSPDAVLFISPLFGVLAAAMTARIGKDFLQLPVALTFLLTLTTPPLWVNASFVVTSDVVSLFFILASMYFFLHYWKRSQRWDLVLSSFALSLAILFRYPNLIIAIVPVAALGLGGHFRWRDAALAAVAALPAGLTVLAFNAWVYGDPLTSGFHLSSQLVSETVNFRQESFFLVQPNVFWTYIRSYFLQVDYRLALTTTGAFALGLAVATVVALRYRKVHRLLGFWALGLFVVLFGYYGGRQGWGIGGPYVNSSLFRYMLPAFVMSSVFLCYGLLNLGNRPNARAWPAFVRETWRRSGRRSLGLGESGAAILLGGIMVLNIAFAYFGTGGVSDSRRSVTLLESVRAEVLRATEPDAIVATNLYDKLLFPDRQTLTLSFAIDNEEPIDRGDLLYSDLAPSPERFAEVARTIFDADIPFYVMPRSARGSVFEFRPYELALQLRGLHLQPVVEVVTDRLYRVERFEPQPYAPEAVEQQYVVPAFVRKDCEQVRGTEFQSGEERQLFWQNCLGNPRPWLVPFFPWPLLP